MNQTITSRITKTILIFCFGTNMIFAQQNSTKTKNTLDASNSGVNADFNKWSFEFEIGSNTAVRPFGDGYNSNQREFFSLPGFYHFDFGVRRMLNSKFGIKSDIAFDVITNKNENGSLPFRSTQSRIGVQGVFDLGKVFEFNTFSKSIGLLAHCGVQVSQFKSNSKTANQQDGLTEYDGGYLLGITPLIKLTDRTSLTFDFTVISNVRQHLNWDGTTSAKENNLTGLLYNTSIGLSFYLGKEAKHSDWYVPKTVAALGSELK